MLWQVSLLVRGKKNLRLKVSEPAPEGSTCVKLLTSTKFPALFILVWQVVMELIVQ